MEAFLQFFYAKYGMISESYALEMIGRPGYPKTYIEATDRMFLETCLSRGSEWISSKTREAFFFVFSCCFQSKKAEKT